MNDSWWVRPDQLDAHQKAVVALPADKDHLVIGPPGSGKTNLLLLRARYAILKGKPNVLVIVFTRTLQEFIRSGVNNYGVGVEQVKTFTSWLKEFLREHGGEIPDTETFNEMRKELVTRAWAIIEQQALSGVYDVILIDEAQDYLPSEVQLFKRLGSVVFAAADGEQRIYNTTDPLAELKALLGKPMELRFHYRNGLEICRLADAVVKPLKTHIPLTGRSNYREAENPSHYKVVACTSVADAVAEVVTQLRLQLQAYPDELLGVVCPSVKMLQEIWQTVRATDLASICVCQDRREGYSSLAKETRVCLSTIHSAKGLEFRALHILGLSSLARTGQALTRNITYTAITRAKTALSLYPCGAMPAFLTSAILSLQQPPPEPRLDDLFCAP